jgi:hypothetical protein
MIADQALDKVKDEIKDEVLEATIGPLLEELWPPPRPTLICSFSTHEPRADHDDFCYSIRI